MQKFLILLFAIFCSTTFAFANTTLEFQNYKQKDITEKIAKFYIKQGIRVDNITDYSLVATKVYTGNTAVFVSSFIYGANINPYPELKYNFNIIQNGNNVLVSLTMIQLTNAGTAYQQTTYFKPKDELEALSQIRSYIEGYTTFGFSYFPQKKQVKVADVTPNLNAYNAGLRKDYQIIEVNEKKVSENSKEAIMQELTPTAQNNCIKIKYKTTATGEPVEAVIKSQFVKPSDNL